MVVLAKQHNIIPFPTCEPVQATQKSNEWYTPSRYIEAARRVMGTIDLDPASCEIANRTVQATQYYSKEDNGLSKPWYGNVWVNPPFGRVNPELKGSTRSLQKYFSHELLKRYQTGEIEQAITLLFGTSLSMPWFTPFWEYPICVARYRINFDTAEGHQDHFGYGNIFVYLGKNEQLFIDVFSAFGTIVKATATMRREVTQPRLWEVQG